MRGALALLGVCLAAASCNGTTGGSLIRFTAYAAGASGASQPFPVGGFSVQLTAAKMHIGAVYVDQSPIGTVAETPVCINPGIYIAQVPGPVDVDLLNDQPQEFSVFGDGSEDIGQSWEMWLTDGDINEANFAHVVDVQGVATRMADGQEFPFAAFVTINSNNRQMPSSDPSQPGLGPICKRRIIGIGGIDTPFFAGGTLNVTIYPRGWFSLLAALDSDFSQLPLVTDQNCVFKGDQLIPVADPTTTFGPPVCVAALSNGSCPADAQINPDDCESSSAPCERPMHCIPNTDFATGAGANEGKSFFSGVLNAGPASYSLTYSSASP